MSKLAIFVSATIVLIFSGPRVSASPQDSVPENSPTPKEVQDRPLDENMNLADPPALDPSAKSFTGPRYYPYRQQLTFRAGAASDFPKLSFDDYILGFQYLFPKFLSPKLEAGADLHENGRGHIHVGSRWIYWERSYFRPSLKAALDHFADSSKGLATLAEVDNWYVRLGGTLEQVVWNPYSIRFESEMAFNFRHTEWLNTLGLSRGW